MKRFIEENLIKWKDEKGRKPLILSGARQVGKSFGSWLGKKLNKLSKQ